MTHSLRIGCDDPNCIHKPKARARGSDDDRRQIIADLISDPDSSFKPDSQPGLELMPDDTLRSMRDQYLGKRAKPKAAIRIHNQDDPLARLVDEAVRKVFAKKPGGTGAAKAAKPIVVNNRTDDRGVHDETNGLRVYEGSAEPVSLDGGDPSFKVMAAGVSLRHLGRSHVGPLVSPGYEDAYASIAFHPMRRGQPALATEQDSPEVKAMTAGAVAAADPEVWRTRKVPR